MVSIRNRLATMNSFCNCLGLNFSEKSRIKWQNMCDKMKVEGQIWRASFETICQRIVLQALRMDELSAEIFKESNKLKKGRTSKYSSGRTIFKGQLIVHLSLARSSLKNPKGQSIFVKTCTKMNS